MIYSQISLLFPKTPKTQARCNSQFDRLPDEMIIQILSQAILDLETLGRVIEVSSRMYQLGVHVLNHYRLPSIQISLMIDQEGRNKMTSQFKATRLDPNLSVFFSCLEKRPRRYYASKASPVIRTLSMMDHYTNHHASIYSCLDAESIQSKDNIVGDTSKIMNRKLQIKQEGVYWFEPKKQWFYSYEISQKSSHDYHLLQLSLSIPLYRLITLENKQEKKWSMKFLNWVMNKCL